jgi:hypothetical protein
MNLKNHSGIRPVVLSGDQGDTPAFTPGSTLKFFTKDLPAYTGRLANYLLGFLVTVDASFRADQGTDDPTIDWDDVTAALFESFELRNSLLGRPIAHNYNRGEFAALFSFIGNGMQRAVPQAPFPYQVPGENPPAQQQRFSTYVPASSLLGMKGHHTAQLACLFDNATFEVKARQQYPHNLVVLGLPRVQVTALLLAEPEIRLGPGVQFVRYSSTVSQSATKHQIEALGNTNSLQGVEPGAGVAFLAWMSRQRLYGGSFSSPANLEYLNFPARGLDQLTQLDALFVDYLGACSNIDSHPVQPMELATNDAPGNAGPYANTGQLFSPAYAGINRGLLGADFVPLISPKRFLETSKLQTFQGTVDVHAKAAEAFIGEDVFVALQYHSWTPAMQEEVFRKIIDSGVARAVWNTPDLVPSTKIINKQPAGGLNESKTRYFATAWVPRERSENPPSVSK